MLCLKKRRTYSFTQGVCTELPRRTKQDNRRYEETLDMVITTLPRKNRTRKERSSRMVLTVTEDTPADMLAGSMELLVQLPRDHHVQTQRVTVQRSTPMMDLLVQIATAHKLAASSYTLQAIGERGMVLPHQPNTPIGALDVLQVKLLPKQGTFVPRKIKQPSQPFETTFRLQVHLPRNQLYVSRVSPKMNLGEILEEVCREKDLDKNKYELRHPGNLETLDLSLSLQDYHLQEVTLYAKQGTTLGSVLSTQDIMALQRQEERRRQQAKQGVFGFVFKKSKEGSLSTDSLGGRSASPARSDETGRSTSPLQPPVRPQRKRRPAPKPPIQPQAEVSNSSEENAGDPNKDKVVISHSRNSSDSSGYHEASVLSDNPDSAGRLPETLPRRNKAPLEMPRKLAHTSQSSKSLSNLASVPGTLSHGISSTSLSSTGLRKKRTAPPPPVTRPLSSAISTQALERIVDSEESLTSDIDPSKPPSDIGAPSKANSDIMERPKASSDIGVTAVKSKLSSTIDFIKPDSRKPEVDLETAKCDVQPLYSTGSVNVKLPNTEHSHSASVEDSPVDARTASKRVGEPIPLPKPRAATTVRPVASERKLAPLILLSRDFNSGSNKVGSLSNTLTSQNSTKNVNSSIIDEKRSITSSGSGSSEFEKGMHINFNNTVTSQDEAFLGCAIDQRKKTFDCNSMIVERDNKKKLSIAENEMNVEASKNRNNNLQRNNQIHAAETESIPQERKLCAVISTMPKCQHLNPLSMNTISQNKQREDSKYPRKTRIPRTASKSNDFETNSLERQKRHLTSCTVDITYALNLNVASNVGLKPDEEKLSGSTEQEKEEEDICSQGVGGKNTHLAKSASDANLSETDVLLQKVSYTLSSSLPFSLPTELSDYSLEIKSKTTNTPDEADQKDKRNIECLDGSNASTSTPNLTVNSQQDTSDYVSAADEDLAVTNWEYELPAPPSAFRDSSSPVFDSVETITPTLVSFGDSKLQEVDMPDNMGAKNISEVVKMQENKEKILKVVKEDFLQDKLSKLQKSGISWQKEVISELENKIGTLPQTMKDTDTRRATNIASTAAIAPTDNTLSNFTITTYGRQTSLNIFGEEDKQCNVNNSDERFIRSFATLSRNRSNLEENRNKDMNNLNMGILQEKNIVSSEENMNKKKLEPKIQPESLQKWQSGNGKSNVQRSKSYVSVCQKRNLQAAICEAENARTERNLEKIHGEMRKSTSINNLNTTTTKNNEKFSQWRDNILKRQENPTKEKQLQSLEVLKSILPQLKNAQQSEENVPKQSNDTVLLEKSRPETTFTNEHSIPSNVVSAREYQIELSDRKAEPELKKLNLETNTKRSTYSGPPMINLGSWSERPSAKVQIKMDTDYKFGAQNANGKTVININNGIKDVNSSDNIENCTEIQRSKFETINAHRKESNELAKKLITHTTASAFGKPVETKTNNRHLKTNNDKPIVTGVELKKNFVVNNKQDDDVVDTAHINFKELTKAFGQNVLLKPKPQRSSLNQHPASQIENNSSTQNRHHNSDQCLRNGHQDNLNTKTFTSIVGIQPQSQVTLTFQNGINIKATQSVPAAKGFTIFNTNDGNNYENLKGSITEELSKEPPKPPTMPVIMGVTLKNTRPKSMPVQIDRRDILLESIRNFGGRCNLKKV